MKKKSLLLTAVMAATSLTASAQYVYRDELPVLTATDATEVDDYGFTANWIPITDDDVLMSSKALGYYVQVYAAKTAKTQGEKFYFINTDFSFIKSQYTVDNPQTDITVENFFVKGSLNEPNRPAGWIVVNAGQADGVFTLDCKLNKAICNGALVLSYNDLSIGGGKVHFRFKVRSNGKAKTLGIHMRDTSKFPNEDVSSYTVEGITKEWKEVEFTLEGGTKQGDILITGEDVGNLTSMFLFIDDLQIWSELNEGETGHILYEDKFIKDDIEATSLNFSVNPEKLYRGEDFAYTAHAYNLEGISYDSNLVFVGYETGIKAPEAVAAVDTNIPVVVYNLSGSVVARGTVGNMPTMSKGVFIVKTGDKAQKVVVK